MPHAPSPDRTYSATTTLATPTLSENRPRTPCTPGTRGVYAPLCPPVCARSGPRNKTSRLRQRMEAVHDWSKAMEFRNAENPARWNGNPQQLPPSPNGARNKTRKENQPCRHSVRPLASWGRMRSARRLFPARPKTWLNLRSSQRSRTSGVAEGPSARSRIPVPGQWLRVARMNRRTCAALALPAGRWAGRRGIPTSRPPPSKTTVG